MAETDKDTIAAYSEKADDFNARFDDDTPDEQLTAFITGLPVGAHVLDLGCGPGRSARMMAEAGLTVAALDATPAFVEMARERFGVDARLGTFDDVSGEAVYDGVFANFSLLHAPKADLAGHLARIWTALKNDGLLHIGLKTGTGEKRDTLGRFYAYYTDAEITRVLGAAGFRVDNRWFGSDEGLDGTVAPWIVLHARKIS